MAYIKGKKRDRHVITNLNLTPMIDVFTVLVIFLLKNYSATGYVGATAKDLVLPASTSNKQPQAVLTVAVNESYILVEGKEVQTINQADISSQTLLFPQLYNALKKEAQKGLYLEKLSKGANPFKGEMMIQGDKNIPFQLLEKIMYTAGQAGYSTMSLEVMQKGS
ncbi:MAG: biopolymer transporter ExbD [Deltaproteobacteria bacterium]|nr:biopolymer transporter ExbD [Deltaproteobacteria bacterium]MCL5793193.1 biopolymer transporter ExbD [Deltaproteobacteria bacterium]